MASYAALVSLMHLIDQIQDHPQPPISLDDKQVASLLEQVTCLQEFLEGYSHGGRDEDGGRLVCRIADAAYAAEDIIESHIVDRINGENGASFDAQLYQSLEKVIQEMDFIKSEAMEIKEKRRKKRRIQDDHHQLPTEYSMFLEDSSEPSPTAENIMVGFDAILIDIMDKLTGKPSGRQVIPIVGMGGIGKTTLARKVYENKVIVQYFEICAWATLSQKYNIPETLIALLLSKHQQASREHLSKMSEEDLGETLYKSLSGRRYLIVIDDMWSVEAWNRVNCFFPDNNNGSGIMITSRLTEVAFHSIGSRGFEMSLLDKNKSWDLLRKKVFGEACCPPQLEKMGKKIAKNCKGLPLSLVVIGGLLAKSKRTVEYWEYVAKNLNAIVNLEDNERCLKILSMSYIHLPVYLKPCFLYMGVFPEDRLVRFSRLIKLWVAEGFLKPISGKSLEVVAEDYLKELIDRNLLLVHSRGSSGKIKFCNIHDLLRDLCLREGCIEKFFRVMGEHSPDIEQDMNTQRRVVVRERTSKKDYLQEIVQALQSPSLSRSLIWASREYLPSFTVKLLRVFDDEKEYDYLPQDVFQLVNLRYLSIVATENPGFPFPLQIFWNIQILIVTGMTSLLDPTIIVPPEFWRMTQLRHVKFEYVNLPEPPSSRMDERDYFVLRNLQTLSGVEDFKCSEEVIKRIPNIKKLKISKYWSVGEEYCLYNLDRLHKLESLTCSFRERLIEEDELKAVQSITFPHSLKKLSLRGGSLCWEDIMMKKIGSLPNLEVLKLRDHSFRGPEWNLDEELFPRLKLLFIGPTDLEHWTYTHLPCLEQLVLSHLYKLKEIPSCIRDIATLRSIQLVHCTDDLISCATEILEEQEDYGNEHLQVRVILSEQQRKLMESIATRNFLVER